MLINPTSTTGLIFQTVLVFLSFFLASTKQSVSDTRTVVIVIDNKRLDLLRDDLKAYNENLVGEGWNVVFYYINEEISVSEFKETLVTLHEELQMQGAVLIGSFPYPDENGDDLSLTYGSSWRSYFPFSLISYHPQFWISRIDPTLVADCSEKHVENFTRQNNLIKNYLQRNNEFRSLIKKEVQRISRYKYIYSHSKWYDSLYTALLYLIPSSDVYFADDEDAFFSMVNHQEAYLSVIVAHGNCSHIRLSDGIITSQKIFKKSASSSRLIILNSCSTGCSQLGNPAGAFLFAPGSKTLAVIAPQKPLGFLSYLESSNNDSDAINAGLAFLRKSTLSLSTATSTILTIGISDKAGGATFPDFIHWIIGSIGLAPILAIVLERYIIGNSQLVLYGDGTLPILKEFASE